jgi:pyoverdine/dityrosine biosynthesis protein Dit1
MAAHLERILKAIRDAAPINLVLPAFPGKSPNREKVLGPLPDLAEKLSLRFLSDVCEAIRQVYPRGARIVICSDGRVFSDVVGIQDSDIMRYRAELHEMIVTGDHAALRLFGLDDEYPGAGHWATRFRLLETYGESLRELKQQVMNQEDLLILYRSLTKVLAEDIGQGNGIPQPDVYRRAYAVLQRGRAWGRLIAERFPRAIRLSVQPQPCGSEKLGIRLLDTVDGWLTPWHGVVVEMAGRFVLMRRRQAERLGARVVRVAGRPSHYVLPGNVVPTQRARLSSETSPDLT